MKDQKKDLLNVVSILLIIFGLINILIPIIGLIGSAQDISRFGGLPAIVTVTLILIIVIGIYEMILGLVLRKKPTHATKRRFFVISGMLLCALSIVSLILGIAGVGLSFVVMGIPVAALTFISFVLSVLYIIGGTKNKNV